MLREAQQIDNLEKRLNNLNKKGSSRCYKEIASTNNEDQVLNKIDYEKYHITSRISWKAISTIYWIFALISVVATIFITISIFNPVAEEAYSAQKMILDNPVVASKLGYVLYIILAILLALIIAIIANPCLNNGNDSKTKSTNKK